MNTPHKCPNCGNEIASNYCYNCGWKEGMPLGAQPEAYNQNNTYAQVNQQINTGYGQMPVADDGFLGNNNLSQKNGTSATVTAMDWFKLFGISWLIMLIPFVGGIGSLIYQIVLLCRNTTAPSIKGYLKFQIIFSVVLIVLAIIAVIVVFSILSSSIATYTPRSSFSFSAA